MSPALKKCSCKTIRNVIVFLMTPQKLWKLKQKGHSQNIVFFKVDMFVKIAFDPPPFLVLNIMF